MLWAGRGQSPALTTALAACWGQRGGWRAAYSAAGDEAAAAKRERRKLRRLHNRELRERIDVRAFSWVFGGQAPGCTPRQSEGAEARASAGGSGRGEHLDAFCLLFGRPRGRGERQKFGRAWRQWQRAAGGGGSAGASAGPRWAQAGWSWADFGQRGAPRPGGCAFDEEGWREAGRRRGGFRAESAPESDAGGWPGAWQQHAGGGGGGAVAGHLRQLGLQASWLRSRCCGALRRAYLARAKAEHPDCNRGSAAAERRFKQVQAAYQALLAVAAR